MDTKDNKVEVSFRKNKVHSFLDDLIDLCAKHNVVIYMEGDTSFINFQEGDVFSHIDADDKSASLFWPRIQTDIVYNKGGNNEQRKGEKDCEECVREHE